MTPSEPKKCPICNLEYTGDPNVHITTKYDESYFGLFVKGHPNYREYVKNLSTWVTRTLGPNSSFCIQEAEDGNVVVRGLTYIRYVVPKKYEWTRPVQSSTIIHILTYNAYHSILLDPWLIG